MMNMTFDVAVVGNGPVGKLLAILLAQQGVAVAVLDRYPTVYPLPRAVHFDDEIGRLLDKAGIGDAVRAICIRRKAPAEFLSGSGDVLIRLESPDEPDTCWPQRNFFHQPQLETIMQERMQELQHIRFFGGVEVFSIQQQALEATVHFRQLEQGAESVGDESLRAQFVVGCDGANSFVKGLIGGGECSLDFEHDWLVADFTRDNSETWPQAGRQYCRPERPTTYVPMGENAFRMEFMLRQGEQRESFDMPQAMVQLLREAGLPDQGVSVARKAVYTFRAKWRRQWRKGRLFIAGDAAHLTPPFLGQGLCSGMRDAMNLAWKLPLVLQGHASDALLDSYASERMPPAQALIEGAVEFGKVICVRDPEQARKRDAEMLRGGVTVLPGVIRPPLGPGIKSTSSPLAGTLLPQLNVRQDGRVQPLDPWLNGFALLSSRPKSALSEAFHERLKKQGVLFIGDVSSSAEARPHSLAWWMQEKKCAFLLIRPDLYIYGSAQTEEELLTLMQQFHDDGVLEIVRNSDTANTSKTSFNQETQ